MSTVAWRDVHEGDVLRGKDGKPWTVVAVEVVEFGVWEFTLEHGDRLFTAKVNPELTVEVLERGQTDPEVAVAIAGLQLGGAVVAHQREADGPWYVQATGWTLPDLLAHLAVFHDRIPTGTPTIVELEKLHLQLHDDGEVANSHIHDDTPYRRGGVVPWA